MARLDRVAGVREVAQIGACVGREFSYELVAAVSDLPERLLQAALDQLIESELIFRRGELPEAIFTFKHALVQDAAYESLLKSRRQMLHARIAAALTTRFKERTANEPEVAAHHYSAAGMNAEAVAYWLIAGQRAIERFANAEGGNHLRRGLELLQSLPPGPARDKQELLLQMALGTALGSKGYTSAEVGSTFARARELCQHVGDMPQMFPILFGLWIFYIMRAEFQASHDVAAQILDLGNQTGDAIAVLVGSYSLGGTHLFRGELHMAAKCSETALANYQKTWDKTLTATFGHSAGPAAADWASIALWFLGYPKKARDRGELAIQLARELDHPLTLATVLVHRAFLEAMRGDVQETCKYAHQTVALARDTGILIRQVEGELLEGWAMARMGAADEGIRQLEASLEIWNQAGAYIADPTWLGLLADAHASVGRYEKAQEVLATALAIVQKRGERLWESGLLCLEGRLHLDGRGDGQSAEKSLRAAIDVAQSQCAKMLELEASMRLAALWKSQGKHRQACQVLRPVYEWFTEGSDTKALTEAKTLLQELAQS
jgi:tetratricopeptide (TPR) repeat protein